MKKPTDNENYFDHEADIGIIGRGKSITDAFVAAATSTFAIMADLASIQPKQSVQIDFEESDQELALTIWLNELINQSRCTGIIFTKFELQHDNNHWHGQAWGEPWKDEFVRGTEVKGATLTMLSVKQIDKSNWEARCVVDV